MSLTVTHHVRYRQGTRNGTNADFIHWNNDMVSFNRVVIPTRGNWFQANSLEHEHDESDSCVHLLCVFYQ